MFLSIFIIVLVGSFGNSRSTYLELSGNFLQLNNGGHWLIQFYAPWCGFCHKLEPIWAKVAEALHHTNIKVGRIDCTRFPRVASEFGIHGYPTIKYIGPDYEYTYTGEREKDEILDFATKLFGPTVKEITYIKDLTKLQNSEPIFFAFVGDTIGELWEMYVDVAKRYKPYCHFYVLNEELAKKAVTVPRVPSIFVFKEDEASYFTAPEARLGNNESLNVSMSGWVNRERFEIFLKVSPGNLNDLYDLHSYIVLAIIDEKELNRNPIMSNFRDMVRNIVKTTKRKYNKTFIFGWIGSPEFANSITLDVIPVPYLLVINSTNHHHYLPVTKDCSKMTSYDAEVFLETIYNQSANAYGGNGFGTRLYRVYFDARIAAVETWQRNPLLATFLFTIPVLFLLFIYASIRAAELINYEDDAIDEVEDDIEEEMLETHMKSE